MTRPQNLDDCTAELCERIVRCAVCGMKKPPRGRDVSARDGGWCQHECEGHNKPPFGGHLWPGELAQMDAPDESDKELP